MWYTTIGIVVSGVVFFSIHSSARSPPKTMTKEWQEATNEYLKVRYDTLLAARHMLRPSAFPPGIHTDSMIYRKNASTPSMVSAARITRARDMCRASLQRRRASSLIQRSRSRVVRVRLYYETCISTWRILDWVASITALHKIEQIAS
jgi:Cytochrome c oxidase subunit IV